MTETFPNLQYIENNWNSHFSRFLLIFHDIVHNLKILWYFHDHEKFPSPFKVFQGLWQPCILHYNGREGQSITLCPVKEYLDLHESGMSTRTEISVKKICQAWGTFVNASCKKNTKHRKVYMAYCVTTKGIFSHL